MTARSLAAAFDRMDDFLTVQGTGLTMNAVLCLQEAAGVIGDERAVVAQRLEELRRRGQRPEDGSVLFGILVGLLAAQLDHGASG